MLTLAALPLAAILAACSTGSGTTAGSPRPGDLVVGLAGSSQGWEGDKCISSLQTNPLVYDSLLRIAPDGNGLVGGIAESYSYDAATYQYTFNLRAGATFSNGSPVTAQDVAFSIEQWRAGTVSGSYYATIASEAVVSDSVLTVQMTQPDTFLPSLLTWCTSTIYPANFAGESPEEFFQQPIGAGPFKLVSWTDPTGASEVIKLEPNEHYWGTPSGLKTLTLETIADASQRALQFQSGNIDILDSVDSATAAQVGANLIQAAKPDPVYGIAVNTTSGPLQDPILRKAISLAIDRDALATALADSSEPATGVLPVNVPGAVDPTTPYSFDLSQAKSLMAQSGSAAGVTLKYLYETGNQALGTSAQILQSQLAQIGVTLELQQTDTNTLLNREATGDFELASFRASAISPTIFDPISFLQASYYKWTGADTKVIDESFLAGTAATELTAQKAAAQAVQDDALNQNALIGLYNGASRWAVQPWVKNFAPLQYGFFYADQISVG